ncbi:MAG TPA: GTP-binding protein, partial [bacterium]|nr:GTP-binding protein [bacterium]
MKRHSSDRIRNVAVCGHGGTGKTSLVEAMLFAAKAIERLGRVEEGTTTTDFDAEEIRRRITISAALAPLEWQDHKINLIDTPGYPDFIGEVSGALRAVESIALTVDAVAGVEVQTEKIWALAARASASRLVVVTRMDRENASFARAVDSLQQKFGRQLVPLQSPIGSEGGFSGVVDLVTMQASGDAGAIPRDKIPADALEAATAMRERLVEAVAETDERLTEVYLEQGQLADDALTQGLHAAVRAGTLVPVLCVAATRGRGVAPLLDALVRLLPAPTERDPIGAHNGKGTAVPVAPDPAGPLAAQVWKTMADPYVGKLSYFRVFSGVLKSDAQVWNAGKGKVERIGQLLQLRGKHQEP